MYNSVNSASLLWFVYNPTKKEIIERPHLPVSNQNNRNLSLIFCFSVWSKIQQAGGHTPYFCSVPYLAEITMWGTFRFLACAIFTLSCILFQGCISFSSQIAPLCQEVALGAPDILPCSQFVCCARPGNQPCENLQETMLGAIWNGSQVVVWHVGWFAS